MRLINVIRLIIIYSLFWASFVFTSNAQGKATGAIEDNSDHPYVSWVSQYPEHKKSEVKQSTARRIYEFLVQKNKETALNRPVGILATSPTSLWVLDQGDETVFQVQKNKLAIPRSIRKKENKNA